MSRQATLFQSWGKKQQASTSSKATGGTNTTDRGDHATNGISKDQGDIVNLCDDDDEDMYLAMAMEESLKTAEAEGHYIQRKDPQPSTSFAKPPAPINPAPISRGQKPKVQSSISSLFKSVGSVPGSSTNLNEETSNNQDDFPMTEDLDELPDLSDIEDIPGFDKMAGRMWIYPTNYQVRGYQLNIVKESLFTNTLVSLPTGLGKTFIAAVVMYNFYRWYPQGKVVFMAPTKPLVAQQIEACYNIMGIPQEDTAEMTGAMQPSERRMSWRKQRVFFLTPQVLANDLSRDVCPAVWMKCLVVDEAHKAQGNHAYCQVIRELLKHTQDFRVLALSATPGSDLKAVQAVLTNLLISRVELRTEDSADIQAYSFERKVEKVVVPLGAELTAVRDKYLHVVDVSVQRLRRQGVLYNRDSKSLSKFMVLKARDAFRQNPPPSLPQAQFGSIEGDFALCMSLYHGYELLQLHGLRSLFNFLESLMSGDKGYGRTRTELQRSKDFMEILGMLREKFNLVRCPNPSSGLMSPRASQLAQPLAIGHPKMDKLKEIILQHFETFPKDPADDKVNTRVMIFSQYRDSVNEITEMLNRHRPLVRVMSFIGQSSMGKSSRGFTQKEQLKVMRQFRDGGYNTLVSTCVGEEGLDIGDVDLIICFDAHKSPIRLVQRMGRTGRKRQGRIVMLVTEGKEEKIYNQSQYSKRSIHRAILNGAKSLVYYPNSTRMVPKGLNPVCRKMGITVQHKFVAQSKTKHQTAQKQKTGQPSLLHKHVSGKRTNQDGFLTEQELDYWGRNYKVKESTIAQLPDSTFLSLPASKQTSKGTPKQQQVQPPVLSLSSWMPWQNRLQETVYASHSLGSQHLVQLMDFIDVHNALGEDEDNYGQEMKSYLNEDDILQGPEASSKTSTGILRYCTTTTQSSEQPRKNVKRKADEKGEIHSPARKIRRSEVLPAVSSDEKEENSDADLPEFDLSFTDKSKDKSTESSPSTSKTTKMISPPVNPAKKLESKKTTDLSKIKRKKKKSGQQSIPKVQLIGDYDDDEDFLPADGTVFPEVSVPCVVDPDNEMPPQDGMDEIEEAEEAAEREAESYKDTESQTEEQNPHKDFAFSKLFPEFEPQRPSILTESETVQKCSQDSNNSKAPSLTEIDSLLEKLVIEKGRLSPKDFIELIDTWEKEEKRGKRREDCRKSLFPTGVTTGNTSVCNILSNDSAKDLKISQSRESLKINTSCRQVERQPSLNLNDSDSFEQEGETSETSANVKDFPHGSTILKSQQRPGHSAIQNIKDTRLELETSFLLDLSPWDDDDVEDEASAADPQTVDVPFAPSASTSKANTGTSVPQFKPTETLLPKSSTISSPKSLVSSSSRFSTPVVREAQARPQSAAESFHDPFLEEDAEDDHLFAAMSTPAATGPRLQNTSQITFTQALACVHDSINVAPEESSFVARGMDDSICQLLQGQGGSARSKSRSNSRSRSRSPSCSVQVSTYTEGQGQTARRSITPVKLPEKPQFDLGFDLDLDDFDDEIIPPSPPSSLPFSLASRTSNIQLKVSANTGNRTHNVSPVVRTSADSAITEKSSTTLNQSWDLARKQLEEEEKNMMEDSEESSENSPSLLQPVAHASQSEDSPVVSAARRRNRALVFDSPAVDSPAVKSTAVDSPDLNSPIAGTSFCEKSCVPDSDFQTPIRPPGKMRHGKKAIVVSDTEESPFPVARKAPARSLTSMRSSTSERSSTSASSVLSTSHGGESNDFEDFTVHRRRENSHPNRHQFKSKLAASKKTGPKRGHCGFLEVEAEVSEEDGATSDEAEDEGSDFEASFVNDCTHLSQDVSLDEMHAIYQRSVRSPVRRHDHGRYRLAARAAVDDMDVFSQVPEPDVSHYEQDSFCVGSDYESEEELRRGKKHRKPPKQQKKAKKTLRPSKMVDGRRRICKIGSSSSEDENYRLVSEEASNSSSHNRVNRLHVQSTGGVTDSQPTQRPSLLSRCLNKLPSKSSDIANISKISSMATSSAACSSKTKTNDAPTFTLGFGLDSDFEEDEENDTEQTERTSHATSSTNLDSTRQNESNYSWRHSKASTANTSTYIPTAHQNSKSRSRLSDSSTEGGNVSHNASVTSMSKEERLRLSRLKQQQFREKMAMQQPQQQQKHTHSNKNSFLR